MLVFHQITRDTQIHFGDTVCQDSAVAGFPIDAGALLLVRLMQLRRAMRNRPGFARVFWLHINQLFIRKGWRGQFRIRVWRQYRFANDISPYADIGPGFLLPHYVDVAIGSSVKIGRNVTIYNGVILESPLIPHRPQLGDNVIVYTGAKVIGPLQIGDNSIIGALAFCKKDVPPNSIMYGMPPNVTIKPKTNTSPR